MGQLPRSPLYSRAFLIALRAVVDSPDCSFSKCGVNVCSMIGDQNFFIWAAACVVRSVSDIAGTLAAIWFAILTRCSMLLLATLVYPRSSIVARRHSVTRWGSVYTTCRPGRANPTNVILADSA